MFSPEAKRVLRRLCILLALLACFGVLASSSTPGEAAALTCCSQCEPELQECYVNSCHCDPVTGLCPQGSQSCMSRCNFFFDYCETHCNFGC
jgi:hypothetical protein